MWGITTPQNPNPVKQNLSNPSPIQIQHNFEIQPDLNPNPCTSLLHSTPECCADIEI